jgi:hypothetical protein
MNNLLLIALLVILLLLISGVVISFVKLNKERALAMHTTHKLNDVIGANKLLNSLDPASDNLGIISDKKPQSTNYV